VPWFMLTEVKPVDVDVAVLGSGSDVVGERRLCKDCPKRSEDVRFKSSERASEDLRMR
jgi:hypothetical protein